MHCTVCMLSEGGRFGMQEKLGWRLARQFAAGSQPQWVRHGGRKQRAFPPSSCLPVQEMGADFYNVAHCLRGCAPVEGSDWWPPACGRPF